MNLTTSKTPTKRDFEDVIHAMENIANQLTTLADSYNLLALAHDRVGRTVSAQSCVANAKRYIREEYHLRESVNTLIVLLDGVKDE